MDYPEAFPGVVNFSLKSYPLADYAERTVLDTNIEEDVICRLRRVSS